jgi:hypothetical protein
LYRLFRKLQYTIFSNERLPKNKLANLYKLYTRWLLYTNHIIRIRIYYTYIVMI